MLKVRKVLLFSSFLFVVNGRSWPSGGCPQQQQCPNLQSQRSCECARLKGSTECMQFDQSMYATSLDEAMYHFPNLVSQNKKPLFNKDATEEAAGDATMAIATKTQSAQFIPQGRPTVAGYGPIPASTTTTVSDDCDSIECRACKLHIINGYLQQPVDQMTNQSLWRTKEELETSLGGYPPNCPNVAPQQMNGRQGQGKRGKRQSTLDVGISQTISCDYKKGDPLSTNSNLCGLCSLCWGWRQLPEDFYPRYVNEVICANDNECLTGFGACNSVARDINVLRKVYNNDGSFLKYEQTMISIVNSCECQVEFGSSLYNLVYNDGTTKNPNSNSITNSNSNQRG